jgi:hypothetical protein
MEPTFTRQRISPSSLPASLIAKWGDSALLEGFVPFPKKLLRCLGKVFSGVDALERLALIMAIADYRRPNLTRGPSREFLAFVSGLSAGRVGELLNQLAAEGLITVSEKNGDELDVVITGLLERIDALTVSDSG